MSEIKQGDNGTVIECIIQDDDKIIDIRGCNIEITIKHRKNVPIIKQAQITDGLLGKCEFSLNSTDIQNDGTYYFQGTVTFPDNKKFSSNVERFNVGKKL